MNTASSAHRTPTSRPPVLPPHAVASAGVFLVGYLAVGFSQGALSDRGLPLPDAPASEAAAYYAANPLAATAGSVLQTVSVLGFAAFMWALTSSLQRTHVVAAGRLRAAGVLSVAAMLVSCLCTGVLVLVAPGDSVGLVGVLRQLSFYAGGVGNVAVLGAFVLGSSVVLGRLARIGRPTRWLGYVAGTLALLSVLSIAVYYATAFLPLGRVLCMVWTVVAAAVLVRRAPASA